MATNARSWSSDEMPRRESAHGRRAGGRRGVRFPECYFHQGEVPERA